LSISFSDPLYFFTATAGCARPDCRPSYVQPTRLCISENKCTGADDAFFAYRDVVAQCGVHTNETGFAYMNPAGDNDMRREETMIIYSGVMSDMIAAPESYVIANRDEGLDGVVFQDEAVITYPSIIKN
jgi:hypothetical protein